MISLLELDVAELIGCRPGVSPNFEMSTVSVLFENLKFEISEGSDPNWCFPGSAQLAVSI